LAQTCARRQSPRCPSESPPAMPTMGIHRMAARAANMAAAKLHGYIPAEGGAVDDGRAVSELAEAIRQLMFNRDGSVDTKSEAGNACCTKFLKVLTFVAERLHCEAADRTYRQEFTRNYRILFPDAKRRYRADVLEACMEQLDSFYVNGSQFRIHDETLTQGEALRISFHKLVTLARCWPGERCVGIAIEVEKIRAALRLFDSAWARFENNYIRELIQIEEKARGTIVEAIACEQVLGELEAELGQASVESRQALTRFAGCVAHLNAVANTRRKGRSDLDPEVLDKARKVLAIGPDECDAEHVIARQVVRSFAALREYFRKAQYNLERIDPYLCNNPGLVERLVDWEESWEVGKRYLDSALGRALSKMVGSVKQVRDAEPELAAMCEDCDAELFLVLPRITWLAFLGDPGAHAALIQSILPDAFVDESQEPTEDLQRFVRMYCDLRARLSGFAGGALRPADGQGRGDHAVLGLLAQRAIRGDDRVFGSLGEADRETVRNFMRELEGWSIAAQRRRPDDWNASMAVLLKVLDDRGSPKELAQACDGKFRV